MLLADGGVVQGNVSNPPFPPKQVACLAVYVEGLVNGLPCIIVMIRRITVIRITFMMMTIKITSKIIFAFQLMMS